MLLCEWKAKHSKKLSQYTHFDRRIFLDRCFKYITSPDNVTRHGFYPFIHCTIESRRVKDGKKREPKKRQIYYAAHIDSWIYRYYAYSINEEYNKKVKQEGIDSVAVAYRTDLGKSNIDFAKEAISFIKNTAHCHVMIGDFTDFFDNLDHAYLKKQLCDLFSIKKLPDDLYAVYKNITRFSYVELKDLLELNQLKDNLHDRRLFNSRTYERALSLEDFKKNKHIIKKSPNKDYGIPQGSPISAVLANVYMLETDKKLHAYISSMNGLYMRYSDDFIIVIPNSNTNFSHQYQVIKTILDETPHLELQGSKTKIFCFDNKTVTNCTNSFIENELKGKNIIEFLGFSFDGAITRIRDKTISKYYNKMYNKIHTIIKANGMTKNNHVIDNKNLYRDYSYKGSRYFSRKKEQKPGKAHKWQTKGNFFDYVHKANQKFDYELTEKITTRHMQKIRKQLKKVTRISCK